MQQLPHLSETSVATRPVESPEWRLLCDVRFSPDEIMTDFELALVQSLELEFPGARIHGCYFHFSQCLWRKVQRLGLVEEYKEDTAIRRFIQKSAAIALP